MKLNDLWLIWNPRTLGKACLVAGLLLCGVGVFLLLTPKEFRAVATIRITGPAGSTNNPAVYDPYFIQTEIEVLRSELILGTVVDRLNLASEWSRSAPPPDKLTRLGAIQLLRQHLENPRVRNPGLLDIPIRAGNPDEAARLANAIAEAFRDYRAEQLRLLQSQAKAGEGEILGLLPRPFEIVNLAAPPQRPFRPNRLLLGTCLASGVSLMVAGTLLSRIRSFGTSARQPGVPV